MHPEHLSVQSALCVNQYRGWSSPHRIRSHGSGKRIAIRSWQVDRNRKTNPVLMQKRAKRRQPHSLVVLKHRMQPDDSDVGKELGDTLSLWQAMRHTAGAEHLKCMKKHDLSPKPG